jgi:hypothetical protein
MTRRFALPFRTALATDVEPSVWHYELEPDVPLMIGTSIPSWDYLKPLKLQREVLVHTERLRTACGLNSGNEIRLVVTIHSPQSRYRAVHYQSGPLGGERSAESVRCVIDSANLAGDLIIDTEVVLMSGAEARKPFLAHLPGSRLFSERVVVGLEGSSSRMPTETAKFSDQIAWLGAPRAPWYVSCAAANLHAPVMSALRLYINAEEPSFAEAARRADPLVVTLLGADVTRRIILAALGDEQFVRETHDYEEGTLGEVAGRLLGMCFVGRDPAAVKAMAEREGAKFDAMIQSVMNVVPHA